MLPVSQRIAERAMDVTLTAAEIARYSRHILLPQLGVDGQKCLKAARVLVVGAGGLGSPALLYLAAAGIGTLGIAEFDRVDLSNLQRQVLYLTQDSGDEKLTAAVKRLRELNPFCELVSHPLAITAETVVDTVRPYDIVIDGTDNFVTRYLVHDTCVFLDKPYVYGSIYRFEGQASVFYPPHGPCYRCLFPSPPPPERVPSCAEGGVLGVLPGHIGTLQALEALKLALGLGDALLGRVHLWDALAARASEFRLRRDLDCPLCGTQPRIQAIEAIAWSCAAGQADVATISPEHLAAGLRSAAKPVFLLDVRSTGEFAICRIAGSTLIPLAELERRVVELPQDCSIVVYCKTGMRSVDAVKILRRQGFDDVASLEGGVLAWIDQIDPAQPRY